LRCAVRTYLMYARLMADDGIPLSKILTGAGEHLNRIARDGRPVLDENLWPLLDAEIRFAVAAATGLRPAGALDPRISEALADAALWSNRRQTRLLGMAEHWYRTFVDADR
jgi:hypothetical protein